MTTHEIEAYVVVLRMEASLQRTDFRLFRAAIINYLQKQLDLEMMRANKEEGGET